MIQFEQNLAFKRLDFEDIIPYELLLLADPSKNMIDDYLPLSEVFVVTSKAETLGVIVVYPLTFDTVEIKNVAVNPLFQGKGIGTFLIENVIRVSRLNNKKKVCIGTANSSITQLSLYQKLGFEISEIKWNFFLENYLSPIFENGIQAKHLVILCQKL